MISARAWMPPKSGSDRLLRERESALARTVRRTCADCPYGTFPAGSLTSVMRSTRCRATSVGQMVAARWLRADHHAYPLWTIPIVGERGTGPTSSPTWRSFTTGSAATAPWACSPRSSMKGSTQPQPWHEVQRADSCKLGAHQSPHQIRGGSTRHAHRHRRTEPHRSV
jgi:hypothetical protein